MICALHALPDDPRRLDERYTERVLPVLRERLLPMAGVPDVLRALAARGLRLALASSSVDCVVAIHVLQDLPYLEILPALVELRRVLVPGGALRLGLPDLDRAIAAYLRGDRRYYRVLDELGTRPNVGYLKKIDTKEKA